MTNKELIQKEIKDHIDTLNEKDEEGEETYEHYKVELCGDPDDMISELIRDADIDSTEFNIGFEQGYLRGLEVALSVIKE